MKLIEKVRKKLVSIVIFLVLLPGKVFAIEIDEVQDLYGPVPMRTQQLGTVLYCKFLQQRTVPN